MTGPSVGPVHSLDDVAPVAAPTQTAAVVHVVAADPVVDVHRQRLDHAAPWGVPAHVTVLYPFLPPDAVDRVARATLAAAVRTVPAFECSFATTRWFDTDVVWLRPEPGEPFRRLTRAVWTAFPDHPPHGGAHGDLVPRLTIASAPSLNSTGTASLPWSEPRQRCTPPCRCARGSTTRC